jgi:hypothetical protein
MSAWRRLRCRLGLHLWSYAHVKQYAEQRIVWRECWFCGCCRTHVQDVWSEPVRRDRLADTDSFTRVRGGAA